MTLKHKELLSNYVQTFFIFLIFLSVAVYCWPIMTGVYEGTFFVWQWIGVLLFLIGTVMKWSVEIKHNLSRTKKSRRNEQDFLSTDGWYSFSRNPLYLSQLVIVSGAVIFAPTWFGAVVLIAFFIAASNTIRIEEQRLSETYGSKYAAYKEMVGRWCLTPMQISVLWAYR